MDVNYRRVAKKAGFRIDIKRGDDMRNFPLEKARIQVFIVPLYIGMAAILCWGWVLEQNAPLVARRYSPACDFSSGSVFKIVKRNLGSICSSQMSHDSKFDLEKEMLTWRSSSAMILSFIIGLCLTGSFNVMSTMLVDLYPLSPATATAANNLVRCLMGAAGTAVIIQMIDGMGRGWCFTFIAAVIFFTSPLLWAEVKWGPKWREERRVRVEKHDKEMEQRRLEAEGAQEERIEKR